MFLWFCVRFLDCRRVATPSLRRASLRRCGGTQGGVARTGGRARMGRGHARRSLAAASRADRPGRTRSWPASHRLTRSTPPLPAKKPHRTPPHLSSRNGKKISSLLHPASIKELPRQSHKPASMNTAAPSHPHPRTPRHAIRTLLQPKNAPPKPRNLPILPQDFLYPLPILHTGITNCLC